MSVNAVVFDFYGTLTVGVPEAERRANLHDLARVLGADPAGFETAMRGSWPQRCTGSLGDLSGTLLDVARRSGATPTPGQVAEACTHRRRLERAYVLRLRPHAVEVLRALRERGLRVGLVSDCTHELVEFWRDIPVAPYVEVAAFSVRLGIKKPDPRIFEYVCRRLEVSPSTCLYVGDGGSNELSGASDVGMRAVQLDCADHAEQLVYDPEVGWRGDRVETLSDVLTLV